MKWRKEGPRVTVSTMMKYIIGIINVNKYFGLKGSKMLTAWKTTLETVMFAAVRFPALVFVGLHVFQEGSDVMVLAGQPRAQAH